MIDWKQVIQLEEDIGPESFGEVVEMFIAEVDEAIDNLRGANGLKPSEIGPALHFLKGSASNLGFCDFADYCSDSEKRADSGAGATVDLGQVVDLYDKSKANFLQNISAHTTYDP